jgi:membrane protein required for colicin V production
LSWIVALVVAKSFALDVAHLLPMNGSSETLRFAAGFVLVFIAVVLLGGLLAVLLKKLMASVGLRPVDRLLGALFGSLRGALLLLLVTVVVGLTPAKNSAAWRESVAVAWSVSVLKAVKPMMPRDLDKFLPA